MSKLSPDQESALEKMRQAFPDTDSYGLPLNDATFQRYLRARSYDFEKSSAMLKSTIEWRKTFGLGEMLNKGWDEVIAHENSSGKMYVRGISKGGHPILYMKPGLENSKSHDGNMVINGRKLYDAFTNSRKSDVLPFTYYVQRIKNLHSDLRG